MADASPELDPGTGLQAALLLARGRPEGTLLLGDTLAGAARSFQTVAICVPGFLALRLLDWASSGAPAHPLHAVLMDLAVYLVGWLGYACASHAVLRRIGLGPRWPRFIIAWNWCNVIQYLLLLMSEVPDWLGLPAWIGQVVWIVALFWSVWLEWFATRLTLGSTRLLAGAMVALDIGLGILLTALTGAG